MRRIMGPVLLTLCLAGCGTERAIVLTPDPVRLAECPRTYPKPAALPALQPVTLPDGRAVVLLSTVIEREGVTAHFIIDGRGAWQRCASAVTYAEDWAAAANK